MHEIKEVTVFSTGDSRQLNLWSNIPFFFTTALESAGTIVNRVDISPDRFTSSLYSKSFWVLRKLMPGTTYDFFRSGIHFKRVHKAFRKAHNEYPASQVDVVLSFSFCPKSDIHRSTVLLGDWTYDYYFRHLLGRRPDQLEARSIAREDSQIKQADFVFSLFPGASRYMSERYSRDVNYIGNAVNSLCEPQPENIQRKEKSREILFVGDKKYLDAVRFLIEAYSIMKASDPGLKLNIIGINQQSFASLPAGVTCFGYLDKSVEEQASLYYSLLASASVFVNPDPVWGPFQALLEAMHHYTPVVTTPFKEFINVFGRNIPFGSYVAKVSPTSFASAIGLVLGRPDYSSICQAAHDAVSSFSWAGLVSRMLSTISSPSSTRVQLPGTSPSYS
jgi:glycosyltransferase involved in cell wall biosynthesis